MPERADVTCQDYMYGLDATQTQVGTWIPILGFWGWSFTLAIIGGANGTLYFQATDFDARGNIQFPFLASGAVGQDSLTIAASGPTYWRLGKAYDSTWNTAKWLRCYWGNNSSAAGSKIYVAFSLRRN